MKKLTLILCFFLSTVQTSAQELPVGSKAPNLIGKYAISHNSFNLYREMSKLKFKRDQNNQLVLGKNGKYISEFQRFPIVLSFFSKTCIPCLREIPTLNKLAQRYKSQGIKFLYANIDVNLNDQEIIKLIETYQITVPMVLVNPNEASRKYGVKSLPKLYIINKKKTIEKAITGFEENLEANISKALSKLINN